MPFRTRADDAGGCGHCYRLMFPIILLPSATYATLLPPTTGGNAAVTIPTLATTVVTVTGDSTIPMTVEAMRSSRIH